MKKLVESEDVVKLINELRELYRTEGTPHSDYRCGLQKAYHTSIVSLCGLIDTELSVIEFADDLEKRYEEVSTQDDIPLPKFLPDIVKEIIDDGAILIGSQAWHPNLANHNKQSDYDLVVSGQLFGKYTNKYEKYMLELPNPKDYDGAQGYYGPVSSGYDWEKTRNRYECMIEVKGVMINLMSYDTDEALEVIRNINKIMYGLSLDVLYEKDSRCRYYEALINQFMTNKVLKLPTIELDDDDIRF